MRIDNLDLAELIYKAAVYRQRKFYAEAIELLTSALSCLQENPDTGTVAIVQYSLGRVYEAQGNSFFAREMYEQAMSDWHANESKTPLQLFWPYRTRKSMESACQNLIRQAEQRSDIPNLSLPGVAQSERWLRAS